jgi:hypothetical protein
VTSRIASPVDNVRTARVEVGYRNSFSYKWTGETKVKESSTLVVADQLIAGHSTAGDSRKTSEWVPVAGEDLPVGPDGVLAPGEHRTELSIPADAPAGSDFIAKWAARVVLERSRGGEDEVQAPFQVLSSPPTIAADELEFEHDKGESSDVDIRLASAGAPVGGKIAGTVVVTPRGEVPPATITVFLYRDQDSHPTEKVPAGRTLSWKTRAVIAKKEALSAGQARELPFELSVPDDAEPTAKALHSSVRWRVETSIDYGWTGPPNERARRAVIICSELSARAA